MPTLIGPAIDPTLPKPALTLVTAGTELLPPIFTPPPPGPGDPDVEYVPGPVADGVVATVVIGRAITREPVGWLATADVEDWDEDVEFAAGCSAAVTASAWDPLWEQIASRTWTGSDGHPVHEWDPKGYIAWVYDGPDCVWTGVFFAPIDIGADRVALPILGPSEVLAGRFLGRLEQTDLYEGRGDFEQYPLGTTPPGWTWDPNVEPPIIVLDAVRGTRCLQVQASGLSEGWVHGPKVTLVGNGEIGSTAEGAAFGKWPSNIPLGRGVVRTYTQEAGTLAPANLGHTEEKAGGRPDCGGRWSAQPVQSGAVMNPNRRPHRTWVSVRAFIDPSRYDVVTLRQGVLTGFLEPTPVENYIPRIMRDLAARSLGGSPHGMTTRILERSGATLQATWAHNQQVPAMDALAMVTGTDGGPEIHLSAGWVLTVQPRLGQDRPDLCLSNYDVVNPAWTVDAAGQAEDFVADTGRGDATSLITVTVSQPYDPDRWRITRYVRAPNGRSLNHIGAWTRRHARSAALLPVEASLDVPWALAKQIALGDSPWVAVSTGSLGLNRRMRVLNKLWQPARGLCTLSLGNVTEVP